MKSLPSKVIDKSKNNIDEEEDEKNQETEIEREKNLERFIYYTTYDDITFMDKLRSLFEEINQKAFNLQSSKEIYTHGLSEEERDNNEIDYISGFQLIDKVSRLTIIEGIADKAMKKIKEAFPKTQINNNTFMIFSDSNILFNKRLYSIFDLSLKFIKIRTNLSDILTHFDIYLKANKYKEIFDAFMNLGSILKAETLKDITNANLFPLGESLLLLERKYGDILKEEDLTGKKEEKKIKKKYSIVSKLVSVTKSSNPPTIMKTKGNLLKDEGEESVLKNYNNESNKNSNLTIFNDINDKNQKYKKIFSRTNNANLRKGLSVDNQTCQPFGEAYKRHLSTEPNETYNRRMINIGPRIIANNKLYQSILKKREENQHNINISSELFKKNIEYLSKMKKKIRGEKIWKPFKGEYDTYKQINYYAMRNNHYEEVVNNLREKYLKDKNHFYSYSELALTLSFPMIDKFRNEEHLQYLDNKSKWINKNDFDRYKQPPRDKAYFPKIDKEP